MTIKEFMNGGSVATEKDTTFIQDVDVILTTFMKLSLKFMLVLSISVFSCELILNLFKALYIGVFNPFQ
jgi:hypothetical protein